STAAPPVAPCVGRTGRCDVECRGRPPALRGASSARLGPSTRRPPRLGRSSRRRWITCRRAHGRVPPAASKAQPTCRSAMAQRRSGQSSRRNNPQGSGWIGHGAGRRRSLGQNDHIRLSKNSSPVKIRNTYFAILRERCHRILHHQPASSRATPSSTAMVGAQTKVKSRLAWAPAGVSTTAPASSATRAPAAWSQGLRPRST
ncbi:MAG: hypothetical protein JWP75_1739, partial [Frondihabitans sp.]|nr:hypothetical protein [Frondihabitans sp.]